MKKTACLAGELDCLPKKGFKFDIGPSWLMMVEVFEKLYKELGHDFEKEHNIVRLSPQYRVFYSDKSHIDIYGDAKKDKATFEKIEPESGEKLSDYLSSAKEKYDISINEYLYENADNLLDLVKLRPTLKLLRLRNFLPLHRIVKSNFKNKKLQKALEFIYVFLGCSPYNVPGLLSLMNYADLDLGVWHPMGGMYQIVEKMEQMAKEHGAVFHYNSPVEKIIIKNERAEGIKVGGKKISLDILISNADYKFTEDIFSDQSARNYKKSYWDKKTMVPSAFLIYAGVKGKLPSLIHHNLYVGDDWDRHFKTVFDKPELPKSPSFYVNMPTATDTSMAPKGHENLMMMVPIAPGLKISKNQAQKYASFLLPYIEDKLGVEIAEKIVYKSIFSVSDFTEKYNSFQGNAFGGMTHTLFQNSFLRPKNYNVNVENIFYAGAGTFPGVGVPTSIISGHLAVDRISKNDK